MTYTHKEEETKVSLGWQGVAPEECHFQRDLKWSLCGSSRRWVLYRENSKVKALRWSRFDRNNGGLSQKGRKHWGEWKKRGSEKLRRFLKDFVGHDKDFDPGKPMTDFEQVAAMICKMIYILK